MGGIKRWIEEHPYLTGGLVLGLLLIWFIVRSRSASAATTSTVSTGPSDALQAAELSAGVQQQQAYLAAQTQIAGYGAAVNSQQLQSAASVAASQLSAGVQTTQTAAQLQYGLATLGFTPSTSPFGLTVPISGVTPVLPGGTTPPVEPVTVTNPSTPTPAPVTTPIVHTVTPGVYTPGAPVTSDQTQTEFSNINAGTTGAGSGGLVTVPSVPIYGPADSLGNPTFLGYTSQSTIPSSSGLNWQQYQSIFSASQPNNTTPAGVTQATAANIAAQLDYLNNPNSCHNRVCA